MDHRADWTRREEKGWGGVKEKDMKEGKGGRVGGGGDGRPLTGRSSGRTDWIGSAFSLKSRYIFISFLKKQTLQKKSE